MAGIKARRSPLLGLWWRYSTWMGELGSRRAILLLLAAFAGQRFAGIYAKANELTMTADIIQWTWLALCVYTWVGPALFTRAVKKELAEVRLADTF